MNIPIEELEKILEELGRIIVLVEDEGHHLDFLASFGCPWADRLRRL